MNYYFQIIIWIINHLYIPPKLISNNELFIIIHFDQVSLLFPITYPLYHFQMIDYLK